MLKHLFPLVEERLRVCSWEEKGQKKPVMESRHIVARLLTFADGLRPVDYRFRAQERTVGC